MLTAVINYWAVLVAAISNMALGFLWYGPLFGKQWMGMMGFSKKNMKDMKMTPVASMMLGFVFALITSFVLAHFVDYLEATAIPAALTAAFWIWIGFAAPIQVGAVLWENKPWKLFWLNTFYSLVSLSVMASILALWT